MIDHELLEFRKVEAERPHLFLNRFAASRVGGFFRLDFPEFQEFMIDHGLDRDFLGALQEWVNDTADSPAPHPKLYRVIMEKMQRRAEALTPDVDDEAIQAQLSNT